MKPVAVFNFGLTVALTGAFIRSCTYVISAEFAQSWCSNAPPSDLLAGAQTNFAAACDQITDILVAREECMPAEIENRISEFEGSTETA